jgi:hypothetical protein
VYRSDYWRGPPPVVRPFSNMPTERYVHVNEDGSETDYLSPPEDTPVIKVTVIRRRKRGHTEEYIGLWRGPRGQGWTRQYARRRGRRPLAAGEGRWEREVLYEKEPRKQKYRA